MKLIILDGMRIVHMMDNLARDILDILKKYAKEDHLYANPHFLINIIEALYDYYEIEDDNVDEWAQDMFGM